jgi:hypothetical protein
MAINYGDSGGDPRGQMQNQAAYQQSRYNDQQGPMVNAFAYNYGRGSEANYGDYTDIMNQYRSIARGSGSSSGGGGGGGGGGAPAYSAFTVSPGRASYKDPFKSYAGFTEFSKTGGYSPEDIANMRARGISPIRAAYANAEQNLQRGRSLQGGYSPNMAAAQAQMAREQGQSMADVTTNVDAEIAQARNQGRLSGLGGMSGIEGQRLGADVDISKFNTELDYRGQTYNADAQARAQAQNNAARQAAASRSAASAAASRSDQLRALSGMTNLYGTTPGMSNMFGNQLLQGVGQGGTFGLNMMGRVNEGQQLPGAYDQTMGRIKDVGDMAGRVANPIMDWYSQRNQNQGQLPAGRDYRYDSDDPSSIWYDTNR